MLRALAIPIVLLLGSVAHAADTYVVRYVAVVAPTPERNCYSLTWRDRVLLTNMNAAAATVIIAERSDDSTLAPTTLSVPGHGIADLDSVMPVADNTSLVAHLAVPPGVEVDSYGEWISRFECIPFPDTARTIGQVRLPTFSALVPAGAVQRHLRTDLGRRSAHVNVIVFNAGETAATAFIEVRRACDNTLLASRTASVAAKSVTQIGGLTPTPVTSSFCNGVDGTGAVTFTNVTVDQPSLTIVSAVANDPHDLEDRVAPTNDVTVAQTIQVNP